MAEDVSPGLSFITPLAYDYRYAAQAVRCYYGIAEEVILGLDADRITWSGNRFDLDMAELHSAIAKVDPGHKVRIAQGNFHRFQTPAANERAQRNSLSQLCAAGNWIVQIDVDEMLLDAAGFRQWIQKAQPGKLIMARWLVVWKMLEQHALVIDPPGEYTPVATIQRGAYTEGRYTGEPQEMSPLVLLHDWGRNGTELLTKMRNWGHSRDFDVEAYFKTWQGVTLENYHLLKDFHPTNGSLWHQLKAVPLPQLSSHG